jgi:hypothetical protein
MISGVSLSDLVRGVRLIHKYSLLIIDPHLDGDLLKECREIGSNFEPYMSRYLDLVTSKLNNISETQNTIIYFRNQLPLLLQEQLIDEGCQRRWLCCMNLFLKGAEEIQIRLGDDFQELSRYDVFLSKNPALLLEKYQRLKNHNQFGAICIEELSKKLSLARLIEYFKNGDLATAAQGLRCILHLNSIPELQKNCAELNNAFQQFLFDHRVTLLVNLKTEFTHKNYKVVDKLIHEASSIEKNFGALVNGENLCSITSEVVPLFRQELASNCSVGRVRSLPA